MDLKRRVALLTGGGSGLGEGIARVLAERGAALALADINIEQTEALAARLTAEGRRVIALRMDVADEDQVSKAFDHVTAELGCPDILINNAGITKIQDVQSISLADWDRMFAINVRGTFQCCRRFAAGLIAQSLPGSVVNIASNAAKVTYVGQTHYNASKAAIVNMTQNLAKEYALYRINVNAVCPGAVDTEMLRYCMDVTIENAPQDEKPTIEDLRGAWGPPQLGRLIRPEEVGKVVAFLVSEDAAVIRGQSINVDAGNTPY